MKLEEGLAGLGGFAFEGIGEVAWLRARNFYFGLPDPQLRTATPFLQRANESWPADARPTPLRGCLSGESERPEISEDAESGVANARPTMLGGSGLARGLREVVDVETAGEVVDLMLEDHCRETLDILLTSLEGVAVNVAQSNCSRPCHLSTASRN